MKNVLIISPYFPPTNAADMQRVRMSLPFYGHSGWNAEIVTVDERYADLIKDNLLLETVPEGIKIHKVKAFSKGLTSKFGLGSIALRSMFFYREKVNELLRQGAFDLIYFSTTQFPVCVLGAYWKKKFGIPYVIDIQDPWHSDYYQNKPKSQRPPKYWFSYRLNKLLEPVAMGQVDGLISVARGYLDTLENRYPRLKDVPSSVITFGNFEPDLEIAEKHKNEFKPLLDRNSKNIVYTGRGGADMHRSVGLAFEALKHGMEKNPDLKKINLYFIGTSYAPEGRGVETIMPLAKKMGLSDQVVEITDRIGFYHALSVLQSANALFIPGSDDLNYTASKIYPYLSTGRPLLAIFSKTSSVIDILKAHGAKFVFDLGSADIEKINEFFKSVLAGDPCRVAYDQHALEKYGAKAMAKRQCELFNKVLNKKK